MRGIFHVFTGGTSRPAGKRHRVQGGNSTARLWLMPDCCGVWFLQLPESAGQLSPQVRLVDTSIRSHLKGAGQDHGRIPLAHDQDFKSWEFKTELTRHVESVR